MVCDHKDIVLELLAKKFEKEKNAITNKQNIASDLGADSLDLVELNVIFEKEFDTKFAIEEFSNKLTVGDLIAIVSKALNGKK